MRVAPDPCPGQVLVTAEAEATVAVALSAMAAQARDYAQQAKSANTRRAYRSDWADFAVWCQAHGLAALPAAPVR